MGIGNDNDRKTQGALRWKLSLMLAAIALIVYANTLSNGFAVDDAVMIQYNTIVKKGVAAIPELLTTPHQRGFDQITNDEYRPLSLVMFAVMYQFFGLNPVPYHLVTILLFAACVVLLFLLLDRLFDGRRTPAVFIASVLFAVHPVHTEVAANVKSCDELLCFFFAFSSLLLFMAYSRTGKLYRLLTSALFLLLSLLSKETSITFVIIVPLIFFFYQDEQKKRSGYITASTILVVAVFLAARFSVLAYYHAGGLKEIDFFENMLVKDGLPVSSRMATALLMLGYYLKLLFVPYPLLSDYSYDTLPFVNFGNPLVMLVLAVYITLILIAVWRLIKNRKDPYAFGIIFFLATLALFSNMFVLIKATMGERFLFYPSAGFCLVIGLLIARWLRWDTIGIHWNVRALPVLAVVIAFMVLAVARNTDWKDSDTLYQADLRKAPGNVRLNYFVGYGMARKAAGEPDPATQKMMTKQAIPYLRKAANSYPNYYYCTDLAAAYYNIDELDSAELYDKAALQIAPKTMLPRNTLAGIYMKMKRFPELVNLSKETALLFPDSAVAYIAAAGVAYLNMKQYDSAILYLKKAAAIAPGMEGCYADLAYIYKALGYNDSMRKYEAIAQSMDPGFHVN